jgi:ribA/ribD-fused uncharacterized protein
MIINEFNGQYAFLSNFYSSNIDTPIGIFPTAEHLYQASKTTILADKEKIRLASSPGKAKRMGQKVTLVPFWDHIKVIVMLAVVQDKFSQNSDLAKKLLDTGSARLIEGNTWHDNEWGDCTCSKCQNILGDNLLGIVLMTVRAELKEASK